jgi:hypothetical protein
MGSLELSEGKKKDPTSMFVGDPIIGMNLSSSQAELVQSWGLGNSNPETRGGHYEKRKVLRDFFLVYFQIML